MSRRHATHYDPRYSFVRCDACGDTWQLLDWGCALHRLAHPAGLPSVPATEQARITTEAARGGVRLRWDGGC